MDWQQVKDNLTMNVILAYLQVLSDEDCWLLLMVSLRSQKTGRKNGSAGKRRGFGWHYQLTDLNGQQANNEI